MLQAAFLRCGYLMLFAGAMLEGHASLRTGAFLAHRGYFNALAVIAIKAVASSVTSQVSCWLARTRGREALQGLLSIAAHRLACDIQNNWYMVTK
jgi:membrane protein DedA with SNARE-associated domain